MYFIAYICNIVLVPKWIVFGFLCGMFNKSRQLAFIFESDGVVFSFFVSFAISRDAVYTSVKFICTNWRRKTRKIDMVHHTAESLYILCVTTVTLRISIQTAFGWCCCCFVSFELHPKFNVLLLFVVFIYSRNDNAIICC